MKGFLHLLLALHVAACLCLAQQQVLLAPDLDGSRDVFQQRRQAAPRRDFVPQEEIPLHQGFILQEEIFPELSIDDLQLQEELSSDAGLSPRGRKPHPGPSVERPRRAGGNLPGFPPGQPTGANIGSICSSHRVRPNYGPHNLPQTGFSHLTRQANAINSIEEGYAHCCTQGSEVNCAEEVWHSGLDQFCQDEFAVKTKHYPCCKRRASERPDCFAHEAPNPMYSSATAVSTASGRSVPPQDAKNAEVSSEISPRSRKPCSVDQNPGCGNTGTDLQNKLPKLSFPPGEPSDSSIQNICRLRKFRPTYTEDKLPKFGYGWMHRQAEAINRMENEYKKCCKTESVTCAHDAWLDALTDFCDQELMVKTDHYACCKETEKNVRLRCFTNKAPYPNYDKEIGTINLGTVSESAMAVLCGSNKLMNKQKQIPLLVKYLTDKCCSGTPEEKVKCAEEQKELFFSEVCSEKKDVWKDSEKCCSKESKKRAECFNRSYLQDISIASASE